MYFRLLAAYRRYVRPYRLLIRLPDGYTNSNEFVMELMEKTGVICTPGSSFGSLGEGYVRFALVLPPEEIKKAIASIKESGILK